MVRSYLSSAFVTRIVSLFKVNHLLNVRNSRTERKHYSSHDADGLSGEEAWVAHFIIHNAVEHLLLIIAWERRLDNTHIHRILNLTSRFNSFLQETSRSDNFFYCSVKPQKRKWVIFFGSHLSHQHFINEDPKSPPVYSSGVRSICEHLWGQKLRSSAEGAGPVPITHSFRDRTKFVSGKLFKNI